MEALLLNILDLPVIPINVAITNVLDEVFKIILLIIGAAAAYQLAFLPIGFFFKSKKFKATDSKFNYAILIAARNEEQTIGQLLDSIKKQDYPQSNLTIFVIADDCHDRTAEIAREKGAIVYERPNPPKNQRKKAYALKLAVEKIKKDYATESQPNGVLAFDGYFVFDADNLLAANFITEMNKAFVLKKYDYFTSYLSEKNIETTIVGTYSSIALGGLYSSDMAQHRSSSVLGISPHICGKGFLLRSHLLEDGWKWLGLTEDIEARSELQSRGVRGCFVEAAECFDENPQTHKLLLRQRLRWERGSLIAFCKHGLKCILGVFWPRDWSLKRKTKEQKARAKELKKQAWKPKNFGAALLDGFQKRFSCYNQVFLLLPRSIIILSLGFIYPMLVAIIGLIYDGNFQRLLDNSLWIALAFYGSLYLVEILTYSLVLIRERDKIRGNPKRMFAYMFVWPFFTMYIQYMAIIAMFIPIKWKPIPHTLSLEIEQIEKTKTISEQIFKSSAAGNNTDDSSENIDEPADKQINSST